MRVGSHGHTGNTVSKGGLFCGGCGLSGGIPDGSRLRVCSEVIPTRHQHWIPSVDSLNMTLCGFLLLFLYCRGETCQEIASYEISAVREELSGDSFGAGPSCRLYKK